MLILNILHFIYYEDISATYQFLTLIDIDIELYDHDRNQSNENHDVDVVGKCLYFSLQYSSSFKACALCIVNCTGNSQVFLAIPVPIPTENPHPLGGYGFSGRST
jgi:hypothetical protein